MFVARNRRGKEVWVLSAVGVGILAAFCVCILEGGGRAWIPEPSISRWSGVIHAVKEIRVREHKTE